SGKPWAPEGVAAILRRLERWEEAGGAALAREGVRENDRGSGRLTHRKPPTNGGRDPGENPQSLPLTPSRVSLVCPASSPALAGARASGARLSSERLLASSPGQPVIGPTWPRVRRSCFLGSPVAYQ